MDQEARRVVKIEQEHGDRLLKIEIEAKPRNSMTAQVKDANLFLIPLKTTEKNKLSNCQFFSLKT